MVETETAIGRTTFTTFGIIAITKGIEIIEINLIPGLALLVFGVLTLYMRHNGLGDKVIEKVKNGIRIDGTATSINPVRKR